MCYTSYTSDPLLDTVYSLASESPTNEEDPNLSRGSEIILKVADFLF